MCERTSTGTSSSSPWFSRGRRTVLIPARCAPITFSLIPPTRSTRPSSVISPVMAIPERALRFVSRLTIAVQSAVGGMLLSLVGMAAAAAGWLSPVMGAMAQELIDVAAVLNALRAAVPPKELTDYQAAA